MDNDGAPGDESRVLEYELDFDTKQATQVGSYIASPSVYTFVLGEPTRLADGGPFVNWSAAGQMERLDPAGNIGLEAEHGRRLHLRLPHPGGQPLRRRYLTSGDDDETRTATRARGIRHSRAVRGGLRARN